MNLIDWSHFLLLKVVRVSKSLWKKVVQCRPTDDKMSEKEALGFEISTQVIKKKWKAIKFAFIWCKFHGCGLEISDFIRNLVRLG